MRNQSIVTYCGVKWLLLFVFYLQFLTAELVKTNWSFFYDGNVPQYVMIICIQIFAVALPCTVFMFINSAGPSEVFKRKKLTLAAGLTCVAAGISAQPVASLINVPVLMFLDSRGLMSAAVIDAPDSVKSLLIGILVVALLPAIFEEVLMRGIVLYSMERDGYRFTMFVSAFLFALLHNSLSNFAGVFFLGVVLCYIVWTTQSLLAGIITHFSFNATAMLLSFTAPGNMLYIAIAAVSVVIFIAATSLLSRGTARRYMTRSFFKKLCCTVFSFPILLIILGFIMFRMAQWMGVL